MRTPTAWRTKPLIVATDPFAALVSRALGVAVDSVEAERLDREEEVAGAETQRVRWRGPDDAGSVLYRRYPAKASVEAALLPLLARRLAPVPKVHASGVPPRHAAEARPWLLMGDPGDIVAKRSDAIAALVAARAAVARDATTLQSLGVPRLPPSRIRDEALWSEELFEASDFSRVERLASSLDAARLDAVGATLVHGAFEGGNAVSGASGTTILGWSRAHLGCALIDDPGEDQDGARLAALFAIRWHAWEARESLRPRRQAAELVLRVLRGYN